MEYPFLALFSFQSYCVAFAGDNVVCFAVMFYSHFLKFNLQLMQYALQFYKQCMYIL